jgi:cell surface protein SprA
LNKAFKYIIPILLLICGISLFSGTSGRTDMTYFEVSPYNELPQDTSTRYPVKKTQITNYEDLIKSSPVDLQDPSNIKTEVEYDLKNNVYLFKTKIDNDEWVTPFTLNPEQYSDYSLKQSMSNYFKRRNAESLTQDEKKDGFSLKDLKLNIGALDRIFGPGGVQVKTQGYAELSAGIKHTFVDNPTLSQRNRSRTMFDFSEKIQLNVGASVGDKVNFDLNYDTEASLDFDSKKIKLAYEGKEDEIIKYLEAGNVSMHTTNSLINGGTSLFGVRADLQFGKLKINTVISQQESQSQTVSSQGGVQTRAFEFKADQYDENQHFFLSQYFRDNYDIAMSKAPSVQSRIRITRLEVWITNKRGNFDKARNVVAFADMAEYDKIKNTAKWQKQGNLSIPYNGANNLYSTINNAYPGTRDIGNVTSELTNSAGLVSGQDYEKLESARKLEESEYRFNDQLGYISLTSPLNPDEVLAVAYEYRIDSDVRQVGEFASEIPDKIEAGKKSGALFLKLLKPVSLSPRSYTWDLMMKNIYRLGERQVQKDKFRLNITYLSDTTGTYINYLPEGAIKNEMLLRVMNLDRLNSQNNPHPDGIFDFLEGLTINPENGRIIFPVVEPFGSHLRKKIKNDVIADKYVYQELYDSTLTVARQIADKNKFRISGSMKASASSSDINLNAMNVAKGSVRVTANGKTLIENVDYTVDYTAGTVKILNQGLIDAGTPINVSLENQSLFNLQRKTLLGLNLSYEFSKDFNIGATIMHMYEKPLTVKTAPGQESLKNTVWGLNTSYRTQSQWLTNLIDKLPFVNATAPSQISFNAEFAQMIPGHYKDKYSGGYSYLDDFESAKSKISIINPYGWKLASTPYENAPDALFPEAQYSNDIRYGNNRAHLAWFTIDNLFTRKNSSLRPRHIDKDQLSNHFVREINQWEIYPNKDIIYNESNYIAALNLSYYPQQRGMYNLDATNIDSEGRLLNPEKRWGGITRKIDNRDFEANNIEYIEFWLMDPFVYNDTDKVKNEGGDLYFNLGDVSEDILKDGYKFYENGLPVNDDPTAYKETAWGRVPSRQSTVYAFDNGLSKAERERQDVGYSGLTRDQKAIFKTYVDYLNAFRNKLSAETITRMQQDPFSPLNDVTGDKYHFYRGADYDREEVSILDRYKYYNGTAGNSITSDDENFSTAANPNPDVEDLDQDYTMNETESYFQYKVSLRPDQMEIGKNYISDKREIDVTLRNGNPAKIKWYQFKVPVREYDKKVGNIQDFKTIRFMRMFLTNFKQTTFLRFGTLDLVRGEWRAYTQTLQDGINQGEGSINVSAVNIEENSDKRPVNYVVPPGVSRVVDPNQPQLKQENEQALALQVLKLEPTDARAVYKNTSYDLRRYKRIQMFTHAEELIDGPEVANGEMTVFLRLGSDYKNNYYEYEIPLTITPPAPEPNGYNTNNNSDQLKVWPVENMFDFPLELLKNIKLHRNKEKRKAGSTVAYNKLYSEYDPDKVNNKISVIGNPSLAEVRVMMIGVRNNSRTVKSAEIWVNELRLTDFDEEGGWAAQGSLNIALSDIGSVSITGRKETSGFGSIDQGLMQRRADDFYSYDISTNVDLGRFLPEKAKVSIPLYYGYSNQTTTPKYDPFDQDVTMKESLSILETKAEKDSLKNLAQDKTVTKSLSLTNMKVNIQSKTPMPYDPANFTFGYAQSITEVSNPTTAYDLTKNYKASLNYSYSPVIKTWEPFKNIKSKSPIAKYPKSLGINFLPNNISFNSYITRFYTETLTRDLDSYTLGGDNSQNQFLSWSQQFYWDRDFSISWDLLKNLKISLQTGTRAEIEEPYLQVNKKLNRDDYEIWRDSVARSIKNLGDPLSYKQSAQVTYTLPFNNIPFLDWINSSANYDSHYTWDRGADIDSETEMGNTITNDMTLTFRNEMDLTSLYNKSAFLRKVNQKFEMNRRRQNSQRAQRPKAEKRQKPFAQDIVLNTDSFTIVNHGMNTKNIEVSAKRNGKSIKIKYKRIDENTIRITTKDTAQIKINIVQKGDAEETTLYKIAEYAARGLMSVRSVSVNYSKRQETAIGGFRPGIGDFFGQKRSNLGLTPGLGFAFGFENGEDYIDKSLRNGWLVLDEMSISPAVYNSISKLELEAQVEPIRGLKIQLNALRERNDRTSIQFNGYPTINKTYGGSFSMTTISLSSSFESSNAKNGYKSKAFDKFLANRDIIAGRLENKYSKTSYPNSGFIPETGVSGNYDPSIAGVNPNSADVLIPAFLAAYTGGSANKISLSAFPSLTALLPNWRISYDGLTTLPWFKDKFKRLRLTHAYTSLYNIGSYSSFATWVQYDGDLGFIKNLDDKPAPSSAYDISSVNLVEQFNPLLGAEGTFMNNMTIRARYNYSRNLNLNITSYQIVENLQKDLVIGLGYRINEFNKLIGLRMKSDRGFNNDLNITADLSRRTTHSLIRKIEDQYTEATSGNTILTLKLSAEYTLSRSLLLRAFYDRIVNTPLISTSSYPTANTNFGINLRFTLTQ